MNKIDGLQTEAYEIIEGDFSHGLLLLADHATNFIPEKYENLGLGQEQLARHIAYDIGTYEFTHKLAKRLNVPAVLSKFSRLLIDPNRGDNDPTLVMRIADGDIVEGNKYIDQAEKEVRKAQFYYPYDKAISTMISRYNEFNVKPSLFSIHSFTPFWRGNKRETEVGMLWHDVPDLTNRILDLLRENTDYVVHENQPYKGGLSGDTMDRHGAKKGLEHSLLELRQDYVGTSEGIDEWVDIFANILPQAVTTYKNG